MPDDPVSAALAAGGLPKTASGGCNSHVTWRIIDDLGKR